MMTSSIYGLTNYYSLFTSPLKSYEVNPVTNLMYGALSNKIYSQTLAKKTQSSMSSYLSSLNSNVNTLKSGAKPLSSTGSSSSFEKKALSSNDSSVTGTAASNADIKDYTVNVSKLATTQSNTGNSLASNEASFQAGQNSISIKVGNNQKNIYFNISEEDNNLSSLGKMATAINNSRVGVNASVLSDSKSGKSYLSLTSDKTGTDNSFSIIDGTGSSVALTGIANTTAQAQNAEYTLDGKKYSSQQNTVTADNGKVSFTFTKAEGKNITAKVGTDTDAIKGDIKRFVASYNNMISFTNSNSSNFNGASTLKNELSGIMKSRNSSLESIGIASTSDGNLKIDEKKLDEALSNSLYKVKDTLGGRSGIAEKVYSKSTGVLSNPGKYSKPTDMDKSSNILYNNLYSSNRTTTSLNNMYSGLLFNALL